MVFRDLVNEESSIEFSYGLSYGHGRFLPSKNQKCPRQASQPQHTWLEYFTTSTLASFQGSNLAYTASFIANLLTSLLTLPNVSASLEFVAAKSTHLPPFSPTRDAAPIS